MLESGSLAALVDGAFVGRNESGFRPVTFLAQ